jgi:spore germination protein YaaH
MRALSFLLLAAAGCGAARAPIATPLIGDRFFVAGYHPYWAGNAWTSYPFDALTELYFFEVEVARDGSFLDRHGWPGDWRTLVDRARASGVQVTPTISMHSPAAFEEVFTSVAAVDRLVTGIVALLDATPGLTGVHLDLEVFRPVPLAARDGYTAFVAKLANRLRAREPRPVLSVFTLAFDDDDVYNERALSELADYLVVQGYDFHSRADASAGPVAAVTGWGRLNWGSVVDRFVALGVQPRQIVMAVPMYGYQWPTESGEPGAVTRGPGVIAPLTAPPNVLPELPRARAQASVHGARRDTVSGSPFYVYRDAAGGWVQGWYEDAQSLHAKYEFVRQRGLGGIAIFPLAYGDGELWAGLRDAFSRATR